MKKIVLLFTLVLCIIACNNKHRDFYNNGKLKEVKISKYFNKNDTSTYYYKCYYENGIIKSEGNIIKNKKEGVWEERYSDGTIRWKGNYEDGERIYDFEATTKIHFSPKDTIITGPIQIKVYSDKVHTSDLVVGVSDNARLDKPINKEESDFTLIPEIPGTIKVYVFGPIGGENKLIYKDSLFYHTPPLIDGCLVN